MVKKEDFMMAIKASPGDDAPRLIYADYLEESGESEYASFIRVQCEIAKDSPTHNFPPDDHQGLWHQDCGPCQRKARERELFFGIGHTFPKVSHSQTRLDSQKSGGWPTEMIVRRGFISEIRTTLALWMGGHCMECRGTGRVRHNFSYGRMDLKCDHCSRGERPGIGPTLVQRQPIEKVRVTDKRPYRSGAHYCWYKGETGSAVPLASCLPDDVFELVRDEIRNAVSGAFSSSHRLACITEQAAHAALSQACLKWARRQL